LSVAGLFQPHKSARPPCWYF